jgi:hypothetical protein
MKALDRFALRNPNSAINQIRRRLTTQARNSPLRSFAFECCLQTMFFRPSLLDFATSLGEWDLHGLRKRFAEGVGDEQGAFAILRGAQYGLPTLRVTPTLAGLGVEGGMAVADDWIYAPVSSMAETLSFHCAGERSWSLPERHIRPRKVSASE